MWIPDDSIFSFDVRKFITGTECVDEDASDEEELTLISDMMCHFLQSAPKYTDKSGKKNSPRRLVEANWMNWIYIYRRRREEAKKMYSPPPGDSFRHNACNFLRREKSSPTPGDSFRFVQGKRNISVGWVERGKWLKHVRQHNLQCLIDQSCFGR